MELGKQKKKKKKRKMASQSKNRDIKRTPQVAEYLSTPGTPISVHQCMVTSKAASVEEKSASSAGELEEYENVQGDTKLEDCGSVEVEMRNGETGVKYVKGWRGEDPCCEKEEEEEC